MNEWIIYGDNIVKRRGSLSDCDDDNVCPKTGRLGGGGGGGGRK